MPYSTTDVASEDVVHVITAELLSRADARFEIAMPVGHSLLDSVSLTDNSTSYILI